MMGKKTIWLLPFVLAVALASTSYGTTVVVGNFEGSLGGWHGGDATLSPSTTGATAGTQAMLVSGPGGWHIDALLDAKPNRAALGNKGVKITADVTAFAADMTTAWMQVGMVINATNNNDVGANNNLGWNDLGLQDVARDGQPHTLTWVLPDALTAKIAAADDNISWFEFALISNLDGASVTKFYIDNIQVSYEAPSASILVSSFEGSLGGWYTDTWTAGKVALSTTGATVGTQAMQVSGPGGWQQLTKVDVKPYMAALANKGVTITADVTAFAADMTTTWMQVGMVLNCQGDNGNGANNNLGWNDLGLLDVVRDGLPHTLTWVLSDAVTAKIAGANDAIGWFEFLLISNVDGASVAKFYVDNVQIVGVPVAKGKSSDTIIGDWEQKMDGWVVGGGADVRYSDTNGVTLNKYSLDVYVPTGAWATVLSLNLLDPNQAATLAAFRANTKITADITHLVRDWPVDQIPPWNGTHLIINTDAGYIDLGYKAGWSQNNGDRTDSVTWDYSQALGRIDFSKVTYLELMVIVNANSADYTGWVWFYLDNMKLSGGGIVMNPKPASGAKDVDVNTQLSWSAGAHAAKHNLYLGTSLASVNSAKGASDPSVTFVSLDGTSFDPNSLKFNTMYYWRVDAVNDVNPDSPWKGVVWNFTTANAIIVDNFESYTDNVGSEIFTTWVDGYLTPNTNGATVGNFNPPFAVPTVVRSGLQAMLLSYDNSKAKTSEAVRTWDAPQDWTLNGYNTLKLYVHGSASNAADALYVKIKDGAGKTATVKCTIATIMTADAWTEWLIPVTDFTGVDPKAVTEMTIGVGNPLGTPSKAAGSIVIDDIQIGARPIGLVAYYKLEGNLDDSSGNGFNGTLAGDPKFPATYVNGPTGFGKGMLFTPESLHQFVSLGTFNPTAATGQLTVALWAKWTGLSTAWQGLIGKRGNSWAADNMMWQIEVNQTTGVLNFQREGTSDVKLADGLVIGQWTHIAVTYDGTTAIGYINGVQTVSATGFSFGSNTTAPVGFGADTSDGGNAFNGALDEIRIYDKVLSAAEIKALAGK
jgi:hypothetical protein